MTNKSSLTLLEAHELFKTKRWVDLTHSFADAFISIVEGFTFLVATFPKPKNGIGFPARFRDLAIAKATRVVLW
jgi:hypothetical protein